MTKKPGLSIESAASVTLRHSIQEHMRVFGHVIRTDRAGGQSTTAVYIDGLAGATALVIAGGWGDKSEVTERVIQTLREAIERDLKHLARR